MGEAVMHSGEFNASLTRIATHQQDGADAPLALLMVGMIVALRVTRATMARIAPMAMLMIGMMLTRTCGSHPFGFVQCWVLLWRLAFSGLCSLLVGGTHPLVAAAAVSNTLVAPLVYFVQILGV